MTKVEYEKERKFIKDFYSSEIERSNDIAEKNYRKHEMNEALSDLKDAYINSEEVSK